MAGHPRYASLEDALWSRVAKKGPDDCWLWTAAVASHGYGNFSFRSKAWCTHVVAFRVTGGSNDPGHVLHTCDEKRCCNPAHLYLGSEKDNARDRVVRNRAGAARGEAAGNVKLAEADVHAIRTERTNVRYGAKHHLVLAKRYGVHHNTINDIWSGRTWRSVPCQ